jgi:hypothetical protein
MTPEQSSQISVVNPLSPAFERVKIILFRPFDLGKWFVIGFCAWLANLGEAGGGGGGPNFRTGGDPQHALHEARHFFVENMAWLIPVVIFGALIVIGLWLLFTWLSSRGRFMFLHCVAQNKAEVKVPWHRFREHGNSLFVFRIVVGLIAFAAFAIPVILFVIFVASLAAGGAPEVGAILGLVLAGLCFVALAIVFWIVGRFTTDFVVPIMFLRTKKCVAAWREFLAVLTENKGRFTLYLLFRIVIGIAVTAIIFGAGCGTCCCAFCILAIPYIGTVLLLPILVFERSYSLFYLRQYGLQFDVFSPEAEVVESPPLP